jgi:predicted transposase YbfD/YdcC
MSKGFAQAQPQPLSRCNSIVSVSELSDQFQGYFSEIEDPRVERCRAHELMDILVMSILAVIAGAKGWEDIETYALSKQDWLRQFLALPNGIPCPDTFRRVFERIDPVIFERCFQQWVGALVKQLGAQVIPIDGKTVKGSYDREQPKSALHVVSAWASEHRLVLGQVKVSDKSNEITAIPVLLELLDLAGCIITIDAMGAQTAIARQIYQAMADYVLALKANHPTLYTQIKTWFETAQAQEFKGIEVSIDTRAESGHHRIETRQVFCVPVSQLAPLYQQHDWLGLQSVVMVVRTRHLWNKSTHPVQFYLTSLQSNAIKIGQAIRLHWGIENQLHWTLDGIFAEDKSRVRSAHAPQNLALLRRIALNALNQESSFRRSIRQKLNRAAMDNDYMLKVLTAGLPCRSSENTALPQAHNNSVPVCQ